MIMVALDSYRQDASIHVQHDLLIYIGDLDLRSNFYLDHSRSYDI